MPVPLVVPGVVLPSLLGAAGLVPAEPGRVVSVPEPVVVPLPVDGLPAPGVVEGAPMPGVVLSVGLLPGVVLGLLLGGMVTEPGVPGAGGAPMFPLVELPLEPGSLVPDWANAPPAKTIAAPMVNPAIKFFFTMVFLLVGVLVMR